MRHRTTERTLLIWLIGCVWGALAPATTRADAGSAEVHDAYQDMVRWLGDGPNARHWHHFLKSDLLRAELGARDRADAANLARVYSQYASGAPGTNAEPIRRVRQALAAWIVELTPTSPAELPGLARAAKEEIYVPPPGQFGPVRKRLRMAFDRLKRRIRAAGANGRAWGRRLMSEELDTQLAAERPDLDALYAIQRRFVGKTAGLEDKQLIDVREALNAFANAATLQAAPDEARQTFASLLDDLAGRLEAYAQQPSPRELENIGLAVTQLEQYQQAPRVVWAVNKHFGQPNLHLRASTAFLQTGLSRNVDDTAPVRDVILGTDIYGTGRTIGRSEITPLPGQDSAVMQLLLLGTTHTRTIGYNGPVQIHSIGETDIRGEKMIWVRPDGIFSAPSRASAETHTQIRGITTHRHGPLGRIILKAANKRAYRSKRQAERIAADHAEDRVRRRLDDEAARRLGEANLHYREKFLAPLLRYNVYPERLHYHTTAAGLNVVGLVKAADRLASDRPAPASPAESDLVLQVHESIINNLTRDILLDEVVTQERAIEIYRNLQPPAERDQPLPPEVAIDPKSGPWTVKLASDADAEPQAGDEIPRESGPVTLRIDDGAVRLTVHGVRYEIGGRVHDTAMDITVVYRLDQQPEGWRFVREGDPRVFPPGRDPNRQGNLSVRETALRGEMQDRFVEKKTFPAVIAIDHRVFKGEMAKVGELRVVAASADDGWLSIAWRAANTSSAHAFLTTAQNQ